MQQGGREKENTLLLRKIAFLLERLSGTEIDIEDFEHGID
jgi:hypothetical protein